MEKKKKDNTRRVLIAYEAALQGEDRPPTDCVEGMADDEGFYASVRGKATIPFSIETPFDLVNSALEKGLGSVRYFVVLYI